MLEAKLSEAGIFKKIVEAIKDLVKDCNFECSEEGISIQAMDESHIALVSLKLGVESFLSYRCDRAIPLGVNVESLMKVLKSANNNDVLTLRAEDDGDVLGLVFEDANNSDRISEYNLKLMNISQEHLVIPDTDYHVTIGMPSSEYQRITRDLSVLSESMSIDASKDSVRFSASGEIGDGSINLKPTTNVSEEENSIEISAEEPVSLGFNLKYLTQTCKAGSLAPRVSLNMTADLPILVSYRLPAGHLNFYLAPKISDTEED